MAQAVWTQDDSFEIRRRVAKAVSRPTPRWPNGTVSAAIRLPPAGVAADRAPDEARRDHIAANALLFTAAPVDAPKTIPPHIPFACGQIPQSALRNRPAAVRRSGI